MFFKVGNRLWDIPRKHIHVYTLIHPPVARTEDADDLFGLSGWPDGQTHQANQRNQTSKLGNDMKVRVYWRGLSVAVNHEKPKLSQRHERSLVWGAW
jgi:hypothetical protein